MLRFVFLCVRPKRKPKRKHSLVDAIELVRQHPGLIIHVFPEVLASALVLAHDHRLALAVQVPVGRGSLRQAEAKPTFA